MTPSLKQDGHAEFVSDPKPRGLRALREGQVRTSWWPAPMPPCDGPPAAIAADAVHGEGELASISSSQMPILELSSVSSMLMEAGAPAVPVAEVAAEVNTVPDQRRWATVWWKHFLLGTVH